MGSEISDIELTYMVKENNDDAKDILYEKYNYIIDIIISKYRKTIYALNIDINEIKSEAMLAFTDALIKYSNEKNTSLATFISLVVERKIQNCVRKAETKKNKIYVESVSLDYEYEGLDKPLKELIGDESANPLIHLENEESYQELIKKIDEFLSPFEHDVYELLVNDFTYIEIADILGKEPKQIDNTIQRIRLKIKDLI